NFCKAYSGMLSLKAGANVPIKSPTKEERSLYRKWNRAVDQAYERAYEVIAAPAYTLEGMLMKLHIVGFTIDYRKKDSFTAPYHGMIGSNGKPQGWEMQEDAYPSPLSLIVSLRDDLQRFAGRRS